MIFTLQKITILCVSYQVLHVKQPGIVFSVRIEMKPLSLHDFRVHLHYTRKKKMILKSQHRLVVQFHDQYSTTTTPFMSVKSTRKF